MKNPNSEPNPDYIFRCPLEPQYFEYSDEILAAIEGVLKSGTYINGKNVSSFEVEFSSYIGSTYGIGVNSGTDALILALDSLDLAEGDEIITTPFTFFATYTAIRQLKLTPIFADIDPDTFLIDLDKIPSLISKKTKAILPVHLFGNSVDIQKLRTLIPAGIAIIEDCAQSHGATIRGVRTGTLGDASAFSFFPSKNLGGYGDGGMITTNNPKLEAKIRLRRTFGMVHRDLFAEHGVNSRLDEIQAAILRVKLPHLEAINRKRERLAQKYLEILDPRFLVPQKVNAETTSAYHVLCCRCVSSRDDLVAHLEAEGIQSNIYYNTLITEQPAYTNYYSRKFDLPRAEEVRDSVIALPFYPEMKESVVEKVASAINNFYLKVK